MVVQEPRHGGAGLLTQALALDAEPVLEGVAVDVEAVQQIAAIERHGVFQRSRRVLGQQRLEAADVGHHAGIQRQIFAGRRQGAVTHFAHRRQGLAQA